MRIVFRDQLNEIHSFRIEFQINRFVDEISHINQFIGINELSAHAID